MRDHAGGGESHGSVNVDQGLATLDEGVDELVGNETMGAFMAAVMAEGFRQEVGLPPSGRGIALDHLRRAGKAAASTAEPQPPSTSQKVPKNSALSLFMFKSPN